MWGKKEGWAKRSKGGQSDVEAVFLLYTSYEYARCEMDTP